MRKVYGSYKVESCPFCGEPAYNVNPEGVPVCKDHKNRKLPAMRCACGEYLDMKKGKFGVFFTCFNCGAINARKAYEMNL